MDFVATERDVVEGAVIVVQSGTGDKKRHPPAWQKIVRGVFALVAVVHAPAVRGG